MQSSSKDVIANSAWYTLGNILLKFFSFLLIPLYTSFLSPLQYGEINLALGFSNVVSCLMMCGLQTGVIRFYTDCKGDKHRIAEMFGSTITFVIIISVTLSGVLIFTHFLWTEWIFSSIPFIPIVLYAILISAVVSIYSVYQEFLKGSHQAKKSVILSWIFFGLLLCANLITVILLRWGAKGVLFSTFIANGVMIVYMLFDMHWQGLLLLKIKFDLLKKMLQYSFPLVPHSLSFNISNFFTRVIINSRVSTSMLGLFSLASQFGGIADVVSNSVQSAFQPWLYERMRQFEEGDRTILNEVRSLTVRLLWIYGFIYLLIGAWTQEAIEFMSKPSFFSAWIYVPMLLIAVSIKSPLYFYQNLYYYHKHKTKNIFLFTVLGCIVTVIMVLILVPIYGIIGAIFGEVIGVGTRVMITIIHGKKMIRQIYSIRHLIIITAITIFWLCLTLLPSYLGWFSRQYNIIYKIGCILSYAIFFLLFSHRKINNIKIKNDK